MKYTTIPGTDLKVSKICLGTMTYGAQNTEAEAFEQLDYALSQGVNFIDTAELYSIPYKAETQGESERIIGRWLKKTGNRDKVVIATKIAGTNAPIRDIKWGRAAILEAVNASLERLQTDYIDLYQMHWPERGVNCFGVRDYPYQNHKEEVENHKEILETLDELIKEGKIKYVGLSNETPWGTWQYLQMAKDLDLPRMRTMQNAYSLVHRGYENGMSEVSMRENIGLLAYSPLAFGVLSGKYLDGKLPADSRVGLFPNYNRYSKENTMKAVAEYKKIADKHGISLAQMSLAFVNQLPFVTSNIIGATKMHQLKENIASIDVELSDDIIEEINAVHNVIPNPAP